MPLASCDVAQSIESWAHVVLPDALAGPWAVVIVTQDANVAIPWKCDVFRHMHTMYSKALDCCADRGGQASTTAGTRSENSRSAV